MPAIQTTYPVTHPVAVAGKPVNMENYNSVSRICETVAGIGFGLAVTRGAGDKGVVIGGAVAKFLGITLCDITLVTPVGGTIDKYPRYANMGIQTLGKIWVVAKENVAPGDPVWYDTATGEFYKATAAGLVGPIVGAQWDTTATAGNLAAVSLGIQR